MDLDTLPAVVAMEALPVLDGARRGASVALDAAYLDGVAAAERAAGGQADERAADRLASVQRTRTLLGTASVSVDAIEAAAFQAASADLRALATDLPEVRYLRDGFPGETVVVPEWVRTGRTVDWGIRLYFFREGDAPAASAVVDENVAAIVDGTRHEFEQYQGRLHGYPDCCRSAFGERAGDGASPETRAVAPFADRVDDAALRRPDATLDDVVPSFRDADGAEAFFAREFFPQPGCATARERGSEVLSALEECLPQSLVGDYHQLNYLLAYAVAKTLSTATAGRSAGRPTLGDLAVEGHLLSLPLGEVLAMPRYGGSDAGG